MVVKHFVEGYENFIKFVEQFTATQPTFVLYTGSKLPDGNSWCPDCVEAKPVIEKAFKSAPEFYNCVVVEVGDRHFWKDQKCPFRAHPKSQINVLPTLVKWGTQKRLEGNQLLDNNLIEMLLFEDDE
ncbi:thioredoxin domain-containing protein 17-like [Phymastichus coffea]|uniref:thioredoxin domain-containing protein 17-like n=1 Tax=Phymastichus coffea TaxID=108790 RepID=UPI00273B34AB|nr:thioredoxin domain-containing protein 17-like [Phymastichus coffea]XP_058795813.1 thioredoxin domain-containing protein 17-like [Phymastichus coffea]